MHKKWHHGDHLFNMSCSILLNNFWSHVPALSDWECILFPNRGMICSLHTCWQSSVLWYTKKKKTKQLSCPVISLRKVPKNGIVRSKDSNFKTSFTNFTNWASVQWSYVTFQTLCWAPGLQRHPVVLDQAHFPHILANSEYGDALSILAFYVKMVVYSQWLKI